jgi:hypothetical protein
MTRNYLNAMPGGNGLPGTRKCKSGRKGGDAFILAIACGCSVPEAARRACIGTTTAYKRLEDPAIRKAIAKQRQDILGQAVGKLADAGSAAVDALTENLRDESPAVRNRAAAAILSNMISGFSVTEILARLETLEGNH